MFTVTHIQVQDSTIEVPAGYQPHENEDEVPAQESLVQWIAQLIAEGRYVEAATAVQGTRPPSATWDACEGKQQPAASQAISVHVHASSNDSKGPGVGGQAAASLQQGPLASQYLQGSAWQVRTDVLSRMHVP